MPSKEKTKYMCFICGKFEEAKPDFCSINFHNFKKLKLNEKGNAYDGWFLRGTAHLKCIEEYIEGGNEKACMFCKKEIKSIFKIGCSKMAVYVYRKRGCYGVFGLHDRCFKKVRHKDFFFIK